MLRDAGVRTKLLAVLAIPTLLLVAATALLVGGQVGEARRAGQISALTEVAVQVNTVVHSLQEERSITLGYLQAPSTAAEGRVTAQRRFTDRQLSELGRLVAASPVDEMSEAVRAAVARSAAAHGELRGARASIDAGRFFATETDVFYTRVIRTDLELPGVLAATGTADLGEVLEAYQALSRTIEYATHERDLVDLALTTGSLNEAGFAQASALVAQQRETLQDFQGAAPADTFAKLDEGLAGAQNSEIDAVRRDLTRLLEGTDPDVGAATTWVTAANSRVAVMTNSEAELVNEIGDSAVATQLGQERRALVVVTIAVLGLGLALLLAIGLARRITRPLRHLTAAAGDIGDELPRMVERMQTPGEGPGVVVEPIPVESTDEIGQLAAAFNTVNDVTVRVAKEQAALRASIAEMFVNVARRNQVLLGRQLKALDQMEASEEDPDVLERLFTLDHLATRMRRNAESLLVLAGLDSTRRLRGALPLSDVVRTAVGEIEAFDRIDLSMSDDPDVSGRHALTVAHLLAELLENATHFSNPETRVVVSAKLTGHGVDLTVTDYGLGMSEDEVTDANEKIAHPPVAEIAVSQRLGLFVVGRLASRLEASVELRRGRTAGTVVVVSLPVSVFEGMAAVEAPAPVEESAPDTEESVDEVAAGDVTADDDVAVDDEVAVDLETVDVETVGDETVGVETVGDEQPAEPAPARSRWWNRRRTAAPAASEAAVSEQAADADESSDATAPLDAVDADAPAFTDEPALLDLHSVATDLRDPATFADTQLPAEAADERLAAEAVDEPTPVAEVAPDAPSEVEPEPEVEPTPVAEVMPVPAPEVEPEPVEAVAETVPEPVAELVAEPEPEPAPFPQFAFAPAVDVLPSRTGGGGRFGRHRQPAPARQPAMEAVAPVAPVASVAPVEPAATVPVPPERMRGQDTADRLRRGGSDQAVPAAAARVAAAPVAEAPVADAPAAEAPVAEAPVAAPVADAVIADRPPVEAPVAATPALPARTAPPQLVPVAAGLPTRAAAAAPPTAPAAPTAQVHQPDASALLAQSDLASSALSELRGLYEPTFAPARPASTAPAAETTAPLAGGLVRRTPKAAETAAPATAAPTRTRQRSASEVRGMLSGFRAGVERGRTTETSETTADENSPAETKDAT